MIAKSMLIPPKAVLFDMDGTITRPLLDFPRLKAEMGIDGRPILEALADMPDADRRRAEAILHRHEEEAAANSTLGEGCHELLNLLEAGNIRRALITRNSRSSVQTVLRLHDLNFDVLVTREDGRFKPDPQPLHHACERLQIRPHEAWMVGDGQYDVEAGIAAGVPTIWISHGKSRPFAAQPWKSAHNLPELTTMLQQCLMS